MKKKIKKNIEKSKIRYRRNKKREIKIKQKKGNEMLKNTINGNLRFQNL